MARVDPTESDGKLVRPPKHIEPAEAVHGRDISLPLVSHIATIRSHAAKRVTWHAHAGYELLFLLEGATAYEFRDGQTRKIPGGSFLLIPPWTVHRGLHDMRLPATLCGLRVNLKARHAERNTIFSKADFRWMSRQFAKAGLAIQPFSREARQMLKQLMQTKLAFQAEPESRAFKLNLRVLACAAILEAVRELTRPHQTDTAELVVAAQKYLESHAAEPIRMRDMLEHIGLGRSRMFDLFKSVTGQTPNDYLLRLRVARAQRLLLKSSQSLTQIALETGFSSSQYFSYVFRRYTGQSPSAYRQRSTHLPA